MNTPKRSNSVSGKFMSSATSASAGHAATLTKVRMKSTFNHLEKVAKAGKWLDHRGHSVDASTLTPKQLTKYVAQRLADGASPRTLQNETSHIRRALRAEGRDNVADSCTNAVLGVPSATRIGSGRVTDADVLSVAIERADPATRAWIGAMQELGLRQRELVRAGPSLNQWERQLRSGQPVSLHDGSKGGRSRQICIPTERRERALEAVIALKEVAERQGGRVVASTSLEHACRHVSEKLAAVGLTAGNSGHSLRRQFALDQVKHYRSEGFSEKESLSRVSADLGHGDGRGRWVFNNYIRASEGAA